MKLARERGTFLGVLAGIADWLDLPVALIRVVFLICVIAWPPIILGYFLLYFCLDRDVNADKLRHTLANSAAAEHFRRLNYCKPIYRNQRRSRIAGVCAGIADYLEIKPFSVRLVALLSIFVFGPFVIGAYILCWFVFQPNPLFEDGDYDSHRPARRRRREWRQQRRAERRAARHQARTTRYGFSQETFRDSGDHGGEWQQPEAGSLADAPGGTSESQEDPVYTRAECTRAFSDLESRLRAIEAFITSKRFLLHCQINRI